MPQRKCLDCPRVGPWVSRCPEHEAIRRARREANPRRVARKRALYGPEYEAAKRRWAPVMATVGAPCARCLTPILPGAPWDLGHQRGGGYLPEHPSGNRGERLCDEVMP